MNDTNEGEVMKTMKVEQRRDSSGSRGPDGYKPCTYVVTKVTNSVSPNIGQWLTPEELTVYCEDETWEVTIK